MSRAVVAGVGMTRFGKHMETGLKALGREAVEAAISDAGIEKEAIESAFVGNAMAGLVTGQECIRGQVVLRSAGIGAIPVINVENACASASTALHQASAMVSAGIYDTVLALGVEKLYHPDKRRSFAAIGSAVDMEEIAAIMEALKKSAQSQGAKKASSGAGEKRSMFMDFYAIMARRHMQQYGTTARQFAAVAAKNSYHGSLNPKAQFQQALSVDEVLAEPMIAEPLTRPMCSPIGDGAAAAVIVSERKARELGVSKPVYVSACVLRSGWDHGPDEEGTVDRCVREAYEKSGVGPEDLSIVLVDDRLVVKGRRGDPDAGRKIQYHQMEIAYGPFAKIVHLRMPYDRDGISRDDDRTDGDFDGAGHTLVGELLPAEVVREGIPFRTGVQGPGEANVLVCRGQRLPLPEGDFDRLYLLAAAVGGGRGA